MLSVLVVSESVCVGDTAFPVGKLREAYQYCENMNRRGTLSDSLSWWTVVLDTTEVGD